MIVRSWRTQVDPDRIAEYEQFAKNISLPMFRQQEGCVGALFFRVANMCEVITLWDNMASVDKLPRSATYGETLDAIMASGMLLGKQPISYYEAHGGFIDAPHLSALLETSSL